MKKKNIALMSMVSSLFLLAACGQSAAPQGAATKTPTATATAATTVKPVEKEPRIASLSIHLTNDLLALGITPVGSVMGGDLKAFLPHVADRLQNTKKLGVVTEPDMEALLALKPEVIYLDQQYAGKDIAKYEKIAKSEVFNLDDGTWRDHLKKIGKLVNREPQAETYIKDYEAQATKVKGLIKDKIGDGKAMAIRVTAKELRVMGMKRPLGPLLFTDLGLKPASGVEKIEKAYETISQEVLPDYDADAIFVIVNNEDAAKKVFEQLSANPIWKGLKAVKAGHIYPIADQPWLDYSAIGNKMALDAAEKLFAK
ncbi:iron-hydroxamate ABC transporter substrate-binding protein [Paenibacillus marchantiophytorum]|uniref:Iron-hydroxamate ABC transporter substrate-binding protein n=1 Tax=Paenibacillus marchantiophytorum TaxID=1619310 RepID=A0ABQ2BPE2_9BACL|nr:iron-hydroxamate ABC transporter substrate-binding protein [Paenibacillus marchantiophytorum]GGI44483.1 iron-hydroxamate ABC transporter substrate-binding protein [Paenibacillus marchantiophytorum]